MLLSVARKRSERGKQRQALKAVEQALTKLAGKSSSIIHTSNAYPAQVKEALLLKGHLHQDLGEYAQATEAFLAAYVLGDIDPGAMDAIVSDLLRDKDLSPAAKSIYLDYLSQLRGAENRAQADRNLYLLQALSAPDWQRLDALFEAEEWNEQVAACRSDLAWPQRHLGEIALYFGDYWQATQYLENACSFGGDEEGGLLLLAFALFKESRFEEARGHLDRSIELSPTGGASLLRAHVLRALGEPARAVLDYRRASANYLLTSEEILSYAEVCLNAGYVEEAAQQLDILQLDYDSRWLMLSAAVDRAEGRDEEALAKLSQVLASDEFGAQALAHVLSIIAENPDVPGALDSLDATPEYYRGDSYWTVRGNVMLRLGRTRDALEVWQRVIFPGNELREAIRSAAHYYFSTLYNAGQDLPIIKAVRAGLTYGVDSDKVAEVVVSAISRHVLTSLSGGRRSKRLLKDIDLVAQYFPEYDGAHELGLLRGLVNSSLGNYRKAAEIFSSLPHRLLENEEVALQLARCILHSGGAQARMGALGGLSAGDERAARIRSSVAALEGDWEAAARHLSDVQLPPDDYEFKAAVCFKTQNWAALESMNGNATHTSSYYRIARLLQSGNEDGARQILPTIPEGEPARTFSNWLLGWVHLQAAKQYRRAGEYDLANASLTDALVLWPGSGGPAAYMKSLDAGLMLELLEGLDDRESFAGVLEAWADARGPADPALCHNLALCQLVNGVLRAARGDFEGAVESWENSIAYICVPLSSHAYLAEWVRRRFERYGGDEPADAIVHIEQKVLQYYDDTFKTWGEYLAKRAMPAQAARVSDLSLALRAELRGARMVSDLGGVSLLPGWPDKISAGPIFVSLAGQERAFADFLSRLEIKQPYVPNPYQEDPAMELLDLMAWIESEENLGKVDVAVKERLEKLFSAMRFAAAREEEGNLEAALRRLREVKSAYRAASQWPPCAGAKFRRAGGRPNLALRNPAFERKHGRRRFRQLAAWYEIELLIALGEQEVASPDDRLAAGIEYWREAVSLVVDGDQYEQVMKRIRESAMGRARVLENNGQRGEAIRLLEGVDGLCGNEDLRVMLSRLVAYEGVIAFNGGDWEKGLTGLRRATELNYHSLYAQRNLVTVLMSVADIVIETDGARARLLLEEALVAIAAWKELESDAGAYRDREMLARASLNTLRIEAGEITADELPPEEIIGLLRLIAGWNAQDSSTS